MADENKPAFYPRVGNIKAKNFKSAQPMPFIDDPRAMELPRFGEDSDQFGRVDVGVASQQNLELGRRMVERENQLRRQREADRSPLEKLAGGLQAGRLIGSGLVQSVASIPTAITKGSKAAEDYIAENMYKPTQPLAYEYAGDVGDFLEKLETQYKIPPILPEAVALQYLTGPATSQAMRAAGRGAEQAGRAVERRMEPVVKGALESGGLPREMALAMGANTQSNVIKPKGGNWLNDSVEQDIAGLKRDTMMGTPNDTVEDVLKKKDALNNWVDRNLTNYIKKEMATPEDPVRKLAEEGIVHFPVAEDPRYWARHGESAREQYGGTQMAQSDLAKQWENRTDPTIRIDSAKDYQDFGDMYPEWIKKLDPETSIYQAQGAGGRMSPQDLGFDHILDVLKEDLDAGRIRPEQLNKVSMEQAVRRTFEYDQEMAKKMRETALQQQQGFPTYKEYPEGYKWLELSPIKTLPEGYTLEPNKGWNKGTYPYRVIGREGEELFGAVNEADAAKTLVANTKKLEDALKYEGETMGHCVGGYCPDVLAGNTKIYSLRDAKGEPHVTIEVQPAKYAPRHEQVLQYMPAAKLEAQKLPNGYFDADVYDIATRMAKENMPDQIIQIKGKGNAKPKADYLPFVQDFVRGQKWSDVRDFQNTGLFKVEEGLTPPGFAEWMRLRALGNEPKVPAGYYTPEELAKYGEESGLKEKYPSVYGSWLKNLGLEPDVPMEPPPPMNGMKRGGKVSISNNPDTMMLEVNKQKMKNGVPAYAGGKLITSQAVKAAKVPPPIRFPVTRGPSIPEIRAMAERMAPQVMGEFVRAAPTPSNPKPSTSVVGKTQKQFEREKTLPIEYQNIKEPVTPEEFDYAKKKGALLIGAQGDVTPGNRMLMSIDEQPLSVPVHLQAGPEWELYNPSAWAASDQMAKTYMNRAGKAAEAYDADPYLHYHKMTPDANFYAMHHLNSILGHLRPEELMLRDPKLYQQMVEEIRTRDVGYGKHPEFEGFEDPLNLQIHAQMDPNFRRHLSAIFNGPKFTERYGLNSGQDVLAATSLPELRDLEAGASGYAVVPLDVKAPLKHFEAESQTYDTGFPKAGASGRSKYPSPYQLIYRDTLNWMKENPSENKSSEFGRMNMIVPKQQIDNELIEAIGEYQRRMKELTGKKKGGAVKKAEGGYLKKPAAYINGDEFVNAAKKYGIKDSMNNLNKIVDLVNKGLSVDDAARQVADSGMHKAAGGAIRGDDLILEERPL
jgi:hypothetical protein